VVQMDCDLSHGPRYVPQMLGTLLSADADVVIGSRYVVGASAGADWPWYRRALSGFANAYVRSLLRLRIRDATAGYKLWRASSLQAIDLSTIRSDGYSFQVEMSYRSIQRGLKIIELPINFSNRTEGKSKMSLKVQMESALMPFRIKRAARDCG
jgi:dolichol-phosphate mannosyltransferase